MVVVPPLLKQVSFARVAGWLAGHRPGPPDPGLDDTALDAWVTGQLGRIGGWWRPTCLKRAAIMFSVLRRAGRPVSLHIGVRRRDGRDLEAHAWLTHDGQAYLEPPATDHASFDIIATFPEA